MTALDKKINQLAARHRWNVTPVHDRFIPCYSIVPMDRQERDRIKATLDRCKGLKVKVEQVFSPYAWTCTIYVFDLAEWEAQPPRMVHRQRLLRSVPLQRPRQRRRKAGSAAQGRRDRSAGPVPPDVPHRMSHRRTL